VIIRRLNHANFRFSRNFRENFICSSPYTKKNKNNGTNMTKYRSSTKNSVKNIAAVAKKLAKVTTIKFSPFFTRAIIPQSAIAIGRNNTKRYK
jgi:hypothetical protein